MFHDNAFLSFSEDGLTTDEAARIKQISSSRVSLCKKSRYYVGLHKVMKVNSVPNVPSVPVERFVRDLRAAIGKSDPEVVLACDNGHGAFSDEACCAMTMVCDGMGIELFVDAQSSQSVPNYLYWSGAASIFLNEKESSEVDTEALRGSFKTHHVKLGDDGSMYYDGNRVYEQRGLAVDAIDTVGAGDAYLAAWTVTSDLITANAWAALSCTRLGTEMPDIRELDEAIARLCEH